MPLRIMIPESHESAADGSRDYAEYEEVEATAQPSDHSDFGVRINNKTGWKKTL